MAAKKHYRTNENYIAELNEKTGSIDLFAVKKVVEAVENPAIEMTLQEARRVDPAAEMESEVRTPSRPTCCDASPPRPPSR
jgi:transcription termination/antitermination protein NusA